MDSNDDDQKTMENAKKKNRVKQKDADATVNRIK